MNKKNIKTGSAPLTMKLKNLMCNQNIKSITFRFLLILSFCLVNQSAYAQATSPFDGMAFQSYLVDANGTALSGNKSLKFRIWDADTSGNLKWGETQTVTVSSGNFSVILGEGTWDTSAGSARISLKDLFDGSERYIEITVDGTALAPRLRMLPSPYTFRAKNAETLTDSNGASTLSLNSGKFTMAKPLDVSGNLTATGGLTSGSVTTSGNIKAGSNITLEAASGHAYVKNLYATGSIVGSGNIMQLKGGAPTITLTDSNEQSYFIHTNGNRLYFLQGNANANHGQWNGNRPITIFQGNKVGINQATPSHTLDVNGNARVTGSLFLNGSQGLTKVQGNYGTVRTTGNGNGNWEGYSIDNRYVFMSSDDNFCGLYNDINNKWILKYDRLYGSHGRIDLDLTNGRVGRFQHTNGSREACYDGDANWDFYSDKRLKENISKTENILDRVMKIDVKSFDYIGEEKKKNQEMGFIAQEIEPHFPSIVSEYEDEKYDHKVKSLGYTTFGVIATGAVKELKLEKDSEIASLKEENNKLREELESLKKEMNDRLNLFETALSKITDGE